MGSETPWKGRLRPERGVQGRAEESPSGPVNREAQGGCFLARLVSLSSPLSSFSPFLFCCFPFLLSCFLSSRLCPPPLYFFLIVPLCLSCFISLSNKGLWDFQIPEWKLMEGFLEEVAFLLGILRIISNGHFMRQVLC